MYRTLAVIVALSLGMPGLAAEPKEELNSRTYDVSDLLYKPGSTKSGFDSIDEIIKEIVTNVRPLVWQATSESGHRIYEANGKRLEILATPADHKEIDAILQSLRIRHDICVEVRSRFIAVDPKSFEEVSQHSAETKEVNEKWLELMDVYQAAKNEGNRSIELRAVRQQSRTNRFQEDSCIKLMGSRSGASNSRALYRAKASLVATAAS
jgi:hypothetical protein